MTSQDMIYRFLKEVESIHPSLVEGVNRPDTETILTHLNKAQYTLISQRYVSAGGFKMKAEAFNSFYDDFRDIITGQEVTSLSALPVNAHHGKLGALPTSYMHYLRSDSNVTKTVPLTVNSYQIETITLTGTSGAANISGAGGVTKEVSFLGHLSSAAAGFVMLWHATYLAQNIDIRNIENEIIMTSTVAGATFTKPVITTTSGNLTGTVASTFSSNSYYANQLGTFSDLTKVMTTATNKPIFYNPIILLHKNSFWVIVDSFTTVNSVYFVYVTKPAELTTANTCQLSEFMHEDVVTIAVQDYVASKNVPREKTLNVDRS